MKFQSSAVMALLLGTLATVGCGDDSASGAGGEGGAGATAQGGSTGDGGSNDGGTAQGGDPSTGGAGGAAPITAEAVVELDGAAFELPEGLTVHDGELVVGFALTGAIETLDLATFTRTPYASAPPPPPNTSFVTGLTFDPEGNLYVAYVSFTADAQAGIYRAPAGGGAATLWASSPSLVFPNGFAWGDDGDLFVTDSASGTVFQIDPDGNVSPWVQDPVLAGDLEDCGPHGDIAVGANGIVRDGDALIVASSDHASVVRIPIEADGTAGAIETIVDHECDAIAGLDGITLDDDGNILGAVNRSNRLVRIAPDGKIETLFEGAPLDFPASLELAGTGSDRALYVTSFALGELLAGQETHPAIVRVKL